VLLWRELHELSGVHDLPGFLGNPEMDSDYATCLVHLDSSAQLTVSSNAGSRCVRGLSLVSDGANSHTAAIRHSGTGTGPLDLAIEGCYFTGNRSSDQGGSGGSCLSLGGDGSGVTVRVEDCLFAGNETRGPGGAIFIGNGYRVTVRESHFSQNVSANGFTVWDGRGGAIALAAPTDRASLVIENCTFDDNGAWGPGGALFIDGGDLTLIRVMLMNNRSDVGNSTLWAAGGGLLFRRTDADPDTLSLVVRDCIVQGNVADHPGSDWAGDGGGILVKGQEGCYVDVLVEDSVFQENYGAQGGGIYVGRYATGTVRRCRFIENGSQRQGGATFKGGAFLANLGELVTYEYCLFQGNRTGVATDGQDSGVEGRGGAFGTRLFPRAHFVNCTFRDNVACGPYHLGDAIYHAVEGGAFDTDLKRCTLTNCLFYGTTGNDVQVRADGARGFTTVRNCVLAPGQFIGEGVAFQDTILLTDSPFTSPADPSLAEGCPCIDAGLDLGLELDLFHHTVPQGQGPDIGALESQTLVHVSVPLLTDFRVDPRQGPRLSWRLAGPSPEGHLRVLRVLHPGGSYLAVPGPDPSLQGDRWVWEDPSAPAGRTIRYQVSLQSGATTVVLHESAPILVPLPADRLLAIEPNPFNPRTTIRYVLARPGAVRVVVYGLDGRHVATLFAGAQAAGTHELVWDGTDDTGRGVAAGCYLCCLEATAGRSTRMLTIVR